MDEPEQSSDAWMRAFSRIYQALPRVAHEPCPHCGKDALRVLFVGTAGTMGGYGYFWCDSCLLGIWISRVAIPVGVEVLPRDHTAEELAARVPRFTLVDNNGEDHHSAAPVE